MCLPKFPIKLLNIWSEMDFGLESQMYKPHCKILIKWDYLVLKDTLCQIFPQSSPLTNIENSVQNGRTVLSLPILPILNYIRVVRFYQSCQISVWTNFSKLITIQGKKFKIGKTYIGSILFLEWLIYLVM